MKPDVLTRPCPKYLLKHYSRNKAAQFLEGFGMGQELMGLSNGQWSLADMIEELHQWCGDVRSIDISTWTANGPDAARMLNLMETGRCPRMRWVVDSIFSSHMPDLARQLIERGLEIRICKMHAKFVVIRGTRSVVLRTSMNLNANPRIEFFEVSESEELAVFFTNFVDKIFANDAHRRVRLADIPGQDQDWLNGLEI